MNKMMLLSFVGAMGCAAMKGQVKYNGPPSSIPQIHAEYRIVPTFSGMSPMAKWRRADFLIVDNPSYADMTLTVDCDGYTVYPDVFIPAQHSQMFLINSSDHKCWVRDWR